MSKLALLLPFAAMTTASTAHPFSKVLTEEAKLMTSIDTVSAPLAAADKEAAELAQKVVNRHREKVREIAIEQTRLKYNEKQEIESITYPTANLLTEEEYLEFLGTIERYIGEQEVSLLETFAITNTFLTSLLEAIHRGVNQSMEEELEEAIENNPVAKQAQYEEAKTDFRSFLEGLASRLKAKHGTSTGDDVAPEAGVSAEFSTSGESEEDDASISVPKGDGRVSSSEADSANRY